LFMTHHMRRRIHVSCEEEDTLFQEFLWGIGCLILT
jgi:hypothetical protein